MSAVFAQQSSEAAHAVMSEHLAQQSSDCAYAVMSEHLAQQSARIVTIQSFRRY